MNTDKNNTQLPQSSVSDSYVWAFLYCPCIHESSFGTMEAWDVQKFPVLE